jgi:hypothetical protein
MEKKERKFNKRAVKAVAAQNRITMKEKVNDLKLEKTATKVYYKKLTRKNKKIF